MALAYIQELSAVMADGGGTVQIPSQPALRDQAPVAIGGGTSQPFGVGTRFARINVDATCSFLFSGNGTPATTNNARMAQNQTEYFKVNPGDTVSFVANT